MNTSSGKISGNAILPAFNYDYKNRGRMYKVKNPKWESSTNSAYDPGRGGARDQLKKEQTKWHKRKNS